MTGSAAAARDAVARERASFETSKAFWPVAFWTAQQLILDIFAARARTREGKLQVELAQLRYLLPWLGGGGNSLHRLGAGIGTRGPGEMKLEGDRRRMRQRIGRPCGDLEVVRRRRGHLVDRWRQGFLAEAGAAVVTMRGAAGASLAVALLVGGCAARVPIVTTPAFPDFVFPAVPPEYTATGSEPEQRDAWAFLQVGQLDEAERRFAGLMERDADFYPASAGLGWVDVARGSYVDAVDHFDDALDAAGNYLPALVGRADALLATDDVGAALASFEAALAVDPGLERVVGIVGELRFQVMSERHAQARAAVEAGRLADAEAAYEDVIAASPESAFLYLELAEIKQQQGELDEALAHTRRARRLEPNEPDAVLMEGVLLESLGDLEAAEASYALAEALNPTRESEQGLLRVRRALQLALLPVEYRDIPDIESATRGTSRHCSACG